MGGECISDAVVWQGKHKGFWWGKSLGKHDN
jgi:hypothetical protein